jgi:small-conductance mechanosensitive channel/CRP-like cAMP-binding protein
MAVAPTMIDAPEGWQLHDFWADLVLDLRQHETAVWLGLLFGALLLLGRALLPPSERKRLRLALAFFVLFFLLWPVRAAFLARGAVDYYPPFQLAATVLLAWGIIGVGGLVFFDLLGRRVGVPKILRDLTNFVSSVVALVVILSRSGVNFLSIITTSAVLTAVLGLALQDTLGSLLSGIALQLEASFAIGDWIRVDDRPIGRVLEIRWRSTVLRTKNDELVVIPNGIITKGMITNFNKDGLENRRWVYFNVHLRHPPNQVQKIVRDALKGTPNVSEQTPPDCITWRFHESWLEYAVRYRLIDFLPDDPTDSEVRKRIWYALHRNNIEMPYPGYNLFVTQLDAAHEHDKSERELARRMEAVMRVDFFAPLDGAERRQLAVGLVHRVYGLGEVLVRAGAEAHDLYILSDGEVSVRVSAEGLEKEVSTLGPGQFFGEMALMTGQLRTATVVAKCDVDCYVLHRPIFKELLDKNPALVEKMSKLLAERRAQQLVAREGLSAEAAAHAADHQALKDRILAFFGIAA